MRGRRGTIGMLLGVLLAMLGAASARADVVDDRLAAVSRGPGDVVLFARGPDGDLLVREGIEGTWRSAGGQLTSGPAAMTRPDGTLDVFVRWTDDAIWHTSKPPGQGWSAWESLEGVAVSGPGAVFRTNAGTIDLFAVGTDRALFHRSWTPEGGWTGWESLGGNVDGAPSPVSRKTSWLDVYVRGGGDNGVYNKPYYDGRFAEYDPVTGHTLSAPSAITRGGGNLDVFVRGTDRALHQRTFVEGSGYTPWAQIDPAPLASGPAAVADGATRVHVFARTADGAMVKSFEDGKGWAAWRSIGPVAPPSPPSPPSPPPPPPPPPPPEPQDPKVGGGTVSLGTGLGCTPRGQRVRVSVDVRKRRGRAKPRVRRVVFFLGRGRARVARTDRRAPYRRRLRVDLRPGTHRVYARIVFRRPGSRKLHRKTVSRRFAVCA